jgi:hypothetical protein
MAPSPSPSAGEGSNENLTTDQKVAFRKLAKASVARHEGPFAEFVPVDVRPIQQLSETVTVSIGAGLHPWTHLQHSAISGRWKATYFHISYCLLAKLKSSRI